MSTIRSHYKIEDIKSSDSEHVTNRKILVLLENLEKSLVTAAKHFFVSAKFQSHTASMNCY